MSKNITIQEGGLAKQITADKLKTNLVGGGSCLWEPEDDTNLGTKHISENGTFRASDDGYFGYSEVTVSGVGTATGTDPNTGEEKRVSADPETGNLEETIIPKSIQITTLPTKVNYTNGETIDYSGIVVHAYSSTGRDLGAVPFNELVFPVTIALASGDEWTDGQGLNAMMLYYTPHYTYLYNSQGEITNTYTYYVSDQALGTLNGRQATYGSQESPATVLATRYEGENYLVSLTGQTYGNLFNRHTHSDTDVWDGWVFAGSSGRVQTGAFRRHGFSEYLTDLPSSTVDPTTVDPSALHAIQTIPVQWPSADAGTTLETSFTINVTGGGV